MRQNRLQSKECYRSWFHDNKKGRRDSHSRVLSTYMKQTPAAEDRGGGFNAPRPQRWTVTRKILQGAETLAAQLTSRTCRSHHRTFNTLLRAKGTLPRGKRLDRDKSPNSPRTCSLTTAEFNQKLQTMSNLESSRIFAN